MFFLRKRLGRMAPDEAAAFWVVRHQRDRRTTGEHRLFDAWLADPVNAKVYAAMAELYDLLGRMRRGGAHR